MSEGGISAVALKVTDGDRSFTNDQVIDHHTKVTPINTSNNLFSSPLLFYSLILLRKLTIFSIFTFLHFCFVIEWNFESFRFRRVNEILENLCQLRRLKCLPMNSVFACCSNSVEVSCWLALIGLVCRVSGLFKSFRIEIFLSIASWIWLKTNLLLSKNCKIIVLNKLCKF